jgi:uncharacterized protein with LGFP repeats
MSTRISPPARRALEQLLAWKLALHGVPAQGTVTVRVNPAGASYARFPAGAHVGLPRIAGHRDGDSTDCPGHVLYGELPAIRAAVQRLAPRPVRATLATAASPATPGAQPPAAGGGDAPSTRILLGTVRFLDGAPVAGARVQLQARAVSRRGELVAERTLAEAVTDASGSWALPASVQSGPAGRFWLRAVFRGAGAAGAAVSDPLLLLLGAAPAIPPAAPAPTPPAPAPPAP